MRNNRHPVTVRLNLQRQADMQECLEFWSDKGPGNEKDLMIFAFDQLVQNTRAVKKRVEEEQLAKEQQQSESSESSAESSSDVDQTEQQPSNDQQSV